ncbi:TPA: GIY-YIG nuclease family protein [Vibrio parahaemolyticus]|nr:GIY-YIG nuclease family protein [Vibrio parahaemolyticus]
MNRIMKLGFKYAGSWELENNELELRLNDSKNTKNILYAFVVNGEVKYVGKSTQTLFKRLAGYKNPGTSQATNIKNNKNIICTLQQEFPVDIFVFSGDDLLNYGGFNINLAAGLEDSIIQELSPDWNGKPKKIELVNNDIEVCTVTLGNAYYNQGFVNLPKSHGGFLGSHDDNLLISLDRDESSIKGKINRTANQNGSPRLKGYVPLRNWFQTNFELGDRIRVEIVSPNHIRLTGAEG